MFGSILTDGGITENFICLFVALLLGIGVSYVYMHTGKYTKNFVQTIATLPVLVAVVMLMVNGNMGVSVAVLGAFSLVRFRSLQGTSREILYIFFSMAIGLSTSMGYVGFSVAYVAIVCLALYVMHRFSFGEMPGDEKQLRITIPENLEYEGVFDDIFMKYTTGSKLMSVKTTNLGSMYELTYYITLKPESSEKSMIDDLRCRNGNLNIICGYLDTRESL